MNNIFRKHLNTRFGKTKYNIYFTEGREFLLSKEEDISKSQVFKDMYKKLQFENVDYLLSEMDYLLETVLTVCNIGKHYIFALIYYIFMSGLLIYLQLNMQVTVVGLILMGICFMMKTYEYVSNKFCYIDIHLIMTYRAVLNQLINMKMEQSA